MRPQRPTAARASIAVCLLLCPLAAAPARAVQQEPHTADRLRLQALDLAYNLDHDQALELLRRAVAMAPDDPAPHRSLAAVLWLNMLFRRGAVTVDHYLGSFSRSNVQLAKPPADLDAEFRSHVQRAIALAENRVAGHQKDAQAHFDLGAAIGLQASYMATVEGKMLAGFRAARRAYNENERVLELDPSRTDARLIVGTYRYVVSTMSLPVRMMAYAAGFGGGRARGIQMLRQAARLDGGPAVQTATQAEAVDDSRADAMFALVLVYNREREFADALDVLRQLRRLYPRNRLLLLEAGATALRGGDPRQAEDMLNEGLTMLAADRRPRIPGEEPLWRYKRGAARAALGRTDAAVDDLRSATAADAQSWVSGRAHLELGRLALKRGDRAATAADARAAEGLCTRGNDPACVSDARALLRSANGR